MVADKATTVASMQADTNVKKILPIGNSGWYAMIAGDPTFALDVVERAKAKIDSDPTACENLHKMMSCVKKAYQDCREANLVDEVMTPNLLTKELVVARSARLLPLDRQHYQEVVDDISKFDTGSSLLVCGFDRAKTPRPHIFSITEPGVHSNHDLMGYWSIGIGKETALARLLSMGTSTKVEIPEALYGAFDAKVNAEINQSIGYGTDAQILVRGRTKSVPVPESVIGLLDRVYSSFPRSPFDQEVNASPKDWPQRICKFARRLFPKSKVPTVIFFKKKPRPGVKMRVF
jgi:hypothetical protein